MSDRQYVHVVRFEARDESGTLSVHSTRKQGLIRALCTVAEHVTYDWSDFPADLIQTFARLCSIDDEDSLYNALTFWNEKLDRANPNQGFEEYFRVFVSVEELEADDDILDLELPSVV